MQCPDLQGPLATQPFAVTPFWVCLLFQPLLDPPKVTHIPGKKRRIIKVPLFRGSVGVHMLNVLRCPTSRVRYKRDEQLS